MAFKVCCTCNQEVVSIRGFSKTDGTLIWERQLYQPQLATDGTIWGIAAERDNSDASRNYRVIAPSVSFPAVGSTPASASAGRSGLKLWYRQIDPETGLTLYDTSWHWYSWKAPGVSAEFGFANRPFTFAACFQQDAATINADGWHVTPDGEPVTCRLESYDTYNTTTTRLYRLIATPIRSGGTASMTFTAAANGIRGASTVTIANVVGMSAATFASALDAGLPHIVSITATGGNYPYNHIDFEIEWEVNDKHFSSYTFPSSSAVDPVIRDLTTGDIKGVLTTTTTLRAHKWQWLSETEIVGVSTFIQSFPNVNPFLPNDTGHCVQKMTVSGGTLSSNWVTLPCEYRTTALPPGGEKIIYLRPAVRGGTLIVTHTPGRGTDQGSGEYSTWHQLSSSDGSLTTNGKNSYRFPERFQFAGPSQLFAQGVEALGSGSLVSTQRSNGFIDGHCTLTESLSGVSAVWQGSYGPTEADLTLNFPICQSVADTSNIYWTWTPRAQGVSQNNEYPLLITPTTGANAYKLAYVNAVLGSETFIGTTNPSWSSEFSFGSGYYRTDMTFESPINCRWNTGIQWRMVWTTTDGATILANTEWLDFDADFADWQAAVDAVMGVNYTGHKNCVIDDTAVTQPSSHPLPLMIWEKCLGLTWWSQNPDPVNGQSPDFLANRNIFSNMRIQLKSAEEFGWTQWSEKVGAMAWTDGATVWERSFGKKRSGFLTNVSESTVFGVLCGDLLVCGGIDVSAELNPDRTDVGVAP
jgi:hypothetical protein